MRELGLHAMKPRNEMYCVNFRVCFCALLGGKDEKHVNCHPAHIARHNKAENKGVIHAAGRHAILSQPLRKKINYSQGEGAGAGEDEEGGGDGPCATEKGDGHTCSS